MGRKRDFWDKANRQRKIWDLHGSGSGPAEIGDVLVRLDERSELRNLERRYGNRLDALAEMEGRQINLCPSMKAWLRANGVPEDAIVNAMKSALTDHPIRPSSVPVKLWLANREFAKISKQAHWLGARIDWKPEKDPELHHWLLTFSKPRTPR